MTAEEFRAIALSMPEASESAHMGHPDFRVKGRIFATLGSPDARWGVVMLTPEQQREFLQIAPASFEPAAGAWGVKGSTKVLLERVAETEAHDALRTAWRNAASKKPVRVKAK